VRRSKERKIKKEFEEMKRQKLEEKE